MMWLARCDGAEDDDKQQRTELSKFLPPPPPPPTRPFLPRPNGRGANLPFETSRLIRTVSHLIGVLLVAAIALAASLTLFGAGAIAAANGKPALIDDDLIEGRLDSSRVCGTRYPISPFQQLKLRLSGDGSEVSDRNEQQQQVDNINYAENYADGANNNNLLYIVGGDEVDDDQFWPWSVAIYELDPLNGQRAFICSGSLISEAYILTAAHCIQQSRFDILTPDEIFLKIASVRLDDDRNDFYRVERIHIHPDYTVDRKTNDIALLKIRHGQRLPHRARPICLPSNVANRIDFTDQQVTIIGWGKTSAMQGNEPSRLIDIVSGGGGGGGGDGDGDGDGDGGASGAVEMLGGGNQIDDAEPRYQEPTGSGARSATDEQDAAGGADGGQTNDSLLQAQVRVTSTDQCNRNYSRLEISWLNIDEHFLCASDPQGKRDACQGDSGGPLMWNNQQAFYGASGRLHHHDQPHQSSSQEKWYQLGLVSFGYGCANRQYPGVYTRISYYMPWILKIVNERNGDVFSSMMSHH